ncbi:phage major capsid protein [Nitrosomonas communis]|uniref:phage major capsid protein n=1 Tax=Nitrosomonas communis TaxID=44574 RepID=UPI003D2B03B4
MSGNHEAVEKLMNAFEVFKQANDENLKNRDALLEAKIENASKAMDQFEPLNQKLMLAEQQAKAMQEQLDRVEELLNRPLSGVSKNEGHQIIAAFDRVMRKPSHERSPEDVAIINKYSASLVKSDDVSAGYLLAPPEMETAIIKNIIESTPMRSLATVRSIGGGSLKQPKKTASGSAARIGEIAARSNTGDPAYGMIEIQAPEMYARIAISQQMLEDSGYDMMAELREDASQQFAVKEGLEYISGLGAANQGEGILTNADIAEVVSGSAAAITADGILSLIYAIKSGYAANATLGLNRSTLGAIRKLKDGAGGYLWVPGIANAVPNTIGGARYVEMADMPDIGAGKYPVIYGDFRRGYKIVDRVGIGFQADFMTEADNGLVVFRARKRSGSAVVLPEAIKKLKIAAT